MIGTLSVESCSVDRPVSCPAGAFVYKQYIVRIESFEWRIAISPAVKSIVKLRQADGVGNLWVTLLYENDFIDEENLDLGYEAAHVLCSDVVFGLLKRVNRWVVS